MKASTLYGAPLVSLTLVALACGPTGPDLNDLNDSMTPSPGGGSDSGGSNPGTGGTGSTAGTGMTTTGGSGDVPMGGSSTDPMGGSGGSSNPTGGAAPEGGTGSSMAGTDSGGGTGGMVEPPGPFSPRSGTFKVLVYSKTTAFRHTGSIDTGKVMVTQIGKEQGFTVKTTETNEDFTADGLKQYDVVFFLNVTESGSQGVFSNAEKQAFEEWMTTGGGAYVGVHAATDGLANKWTFYRDLTGQNYNGHGQAGQLGNVLFEQGALTHPAIAGLPSPWQRSEEWYNFNNHQSWSGQPGVTILGRKQADSQPIMWVRQHTSYRMFYTALGHDAAVFDLAKDTNGNMKKHLTGGIMWGARREHCLATPRPESCPKPL